MTVLSLVLAGPLQAWGSSSRFTTRSSDTQPTKSGVIGVLAAARGMRRTDPLEDLLALRFGVRVEQPGELVRDFQTARSLVSKDVMPLSYRHYLADARYLVGLEGDRALLEGLAEALLRPVYAPYLGRRSCPPSEPLRPRVRDDSLEELIACEPWQAARWHRRRMKGRDVMLSFTIDEAPGGGGLQEPLLGVARARGKATVRDAPISFDSERRQYGWRTVHSGVLPRPDRDEGSGPSTPPVDEPDFMGALR